MVNMLVIDDDKSCCRSLELHFGQRGFAVNTAYDVEEGLAHLAGSPVDIVISDIRMPGRDGLDLLDEIQVRASRIPVVMITAFQDLDSTVAALHRGAVDYVGKPIDLDQLDAAVDRALASERRDSKDGLMVGKGHARQTIVGTTRAMQEIFNAIGKVSQSRVTVLICGESGTGKELISRAIHDASDNAEEPFIAVNCAALVETLLESELFGHQRGAFTGAVSSRKGKAELAGEGVLFLDEISELSPRMQGKLLRLLEEREFMTVGGSSVMHCAARFIAATNVDLAERVKSGQFREDLFYRLNVFSICAPPLRNRRSDIPLLSEHLLKRISSELGKGVSRVTSEAIDALGTYDWPGNVRQLNNVLTQAVVMAQGDLLTLSDLPREVIDAHRSGNQPARIKNPVRTPVNFPSLKDLERQHIAEVLARTGWHKGRTCEILGISRPRLDRRIREYGLSARSGRGEA